MNRLFPAIAFSAIFLLMLIVTIRASLVRSVFDNGHLMSDPWFLATLCDAYCGFLTFYVWVFLKETSTFSRLVWFVLVMTLGNFAMAAYVLLQLHQCGSNGTVETFLLPARRTAARIQSVARGNHE